MRDASVVPAAPRNRIADVSDQNLHRGILPSLVFRTLFQYSTFSRSLKENWLTEIGFLTDTSSSKMSKITSPCSLIREYMNTAAWFTSPMSHPTTSLDVPGGGTITSQLSLFGREQSPTTGRLGMKSPSKYEVVVSLTQSPSTNLWYLILSYSYFFRSSLRSISGRNQFSSRAKW